MARELKTRKKTKKDWLWTISFSTIFLGASIFLIFNTVQAFQEQLIRNNLVKNGIVTTGTVTEARIQKTTGRKNRGSREIAFIEGDYLVNDLNYEFNQGLQGFRLKQSNITIQGVATEINLAGQGCKIHSTFLKI